MNEMALFWYRRDLRWHDNKALYYALKENDVVLPVFIFDTEILHNLDDPSDRRVSFIYQQVLQIKTELEKISSSLLVLTGDPLHIFKDLVKQYKISGLYFNKDYEPYSRERDEKVRDYLEENNVAVKSFKDQVVFEHNEILKDDGKPYSVFTPYMNKWKNTFNREYVPEYPVKDYFGNLIKTSAFRMPDIRETGFNSFKNVPLSPIIDEDIIKEYDKFRDYPWLDYTSRLGVHLRFGTVSIRNVIKKAMDLNETWLNQLIWREFFMMILWHHPGVVDNSFKAKYDNIEWRNNEEDFDAWCKGKTGYPFVDAGMRQLNQTGYMHNRARMITASFLTKHLLIDWRWGETYFAEKLMDYELASNNGGWQWASGSGCDAAPYFRIFNPEKQVQRFDKDKKYIRKWVKELESSEYPEPVVDHKYARERALKEYKNALNK